MREFPHVGNVSSRTMLKVLFYILNTVINGKWAKICVILKTTRLKNIQWWLEKNKKLELSACILNVYFSIGKN